MILLGAKTVTVTRPGVPTYSAGELTDGASTSFTIRASIQPLQGKEREDLPEGYRTRGRYKMYCPTTPALKTTDLATGTREDVVAYDGRDFEVIAWLGWADHAAPTAHQKYLLAEIERDDRRAANAL